MTNPAKGPVGMPAPKPKMTAAQKKKADKEASLEEEKRQERERKQELEESIQIDRDAKAKEDAKERSDTGKIFNESDRRLYEDRWLAHQAVQNGMSEQLSVEQTFLAQALMPNHIAEHTNASAQQNPASQHGESSMQQNERSPTYQSTSTQAEDLMQGTCQVLDQPIDDKFLDEPAQGRRNNGTDASTLQEEFQKFNRSMKHQKLQTDHVIKTTIDLVTKCDKPWAGSAVETSRVWIIRNDTSAHADQLSYATLALAKQRYEELKLCRPAHLEIVSLPLRGGKVHLVPDMTDLGLEKAGANIENNTLNDLPESEPKTVEPAPEHWADRKDEKCLDLNHLKKKKKPRKQAYPVEDSFSDIEEVTDTEAPAQAAVNVVKPRARKTKAADTIEVDSAVANNDEGIQGPVEALKKVRKPRAKKSKEVKFVEIDSEVDNDDDDDELEVPKSSSSRSNQGKSQTPAVKKPAAKQRAVAKKPQAKDDEDEDDDVPMMPKSRPARSRAGSKSVVIIDSDDEDDQEGQAKPNKSKPAARQVAAKSQKKPETEVPEHIKNLLNNTGTFLAGRTFVVSGTLPDIGRINIEKLSRLYGAKTSRAITKATTDVVLGENPLAKQVQQLKDLSPNTMNVDDFISMLMSLSNDNNIPAGAENGNAAVNDDGDDGEEEIEDQPPAKRTKLGVGLSSGSVAFA
ncbi:hypothetical protein EAE96_006480 [Botrytis aclada]|nr:hypothetical protein EAE96_006480 [Botrytis aclada]